MSTKSHIFHRLARSTPPMIVSGTGLELIDADGRRYLDACGGAAVSSLGHRHPAVTRAIVEQTHRLEYAHTSFFTNEPAERLADSLAAVTPGSLNHVYLVGSGSEAVEAGLKMARQYYVELGKPQRVRVISRRQSYHGNTLGALAVSGNPARRAHYEPLLFSTSTIEPCFAYHHAQPGETPEAYGRRAANALETELLRVGPETVMAFVAETVVGATAGAVPPAPGYLKRIREICDQYGVLLILDEVMCGAGRTGTYLACEQDDVVPDIVTLAKGLAAGYQPIGAAICTDQLYAAFENGSGEFRHGQTYNSHPIACAAALAVQGVIREEGLLERVCRLGVYLRDALVARLGQHPNVGDIRGRGLLQAIELVADRGAKKPFDPEHKLNLRVKHRAFERGLLVYPGGGTVDGRCGDHILLAPPYIATEEQMDVIVDRLTESVEAALASIPTAGAAA